MSFKCIGTFTSMNVRMFKTGIARSVAKELFCYENAIDIEAKHCIYIL